MNEERKLHQVLKTGDKQIINSYFEEIYNKYKGLVCFVIAKYIKNYDDIVDIAQDVFLSFFNNADKVNSSIKYYLTRSARNISINYIKKNDKEINVEDKYLENLSYVKMEYNDNSLFNDIKNILNEEEYNLIFNHIVMGYSLVELAKEMNLSKNTIKSKYRRALLKLKKELGGKYYE